MKLPDGNTYKPDNWVVIKIKNEGQFFYKILAGWGGGYLNGDSWKLNSGIVNVKKEGDHYNFYGISGSCYICHKDSYMLRMNNAHIWSMLKEKYSDKLELMDENTDWLNIDWNLKLK